MTWIKKNLTTVVLVMTAALGMGLLIYPSFADWWNSFHQSRAVASYAEAVADLSNEKYDEIFESAERYNAALAETGTLWIMEPEQIAAYKAELNVNDSGIMGYIDIPKIHITLPLYHGTDEAILQIAVGHLSGTSLPVGGLGTHCVVSGHRGLPSAKLFTDIDKLVVGDTWTITVLNRTLTYEVDQIRVVEPTDLSDLQIDPEKDFCTLVTCTPYGINTHRLLVRGHRIANAQGEALVIADAIQIEAVFIAPFIAAPILLLLFILMMISTGEKARALRVRKNIQKRYHRILKKKIKVSDKIIGVHKAYRIGKRKLNRRKGKS